MDLSLHVYESEKNKKWFSLCDIQYNGRTECLENNREKAINIKNL